MAKRIDIITRDFIWGSSDEGRKLHGVKWDQVCAPRNMGGLGIRKISEMNVALLGKWH